MKGFYRKVSMLLLIAMLVSMLSPVSVYSIEGVSESAANVETPADAGASGETPPQVSVSETDTGDSTENASSDASAGEADSDDTVGAAGVPADASLYEASSSPDDGNEADETSDVDTDGVLDESTDTTDATQNTVITEEVEADQVGDALMTTSLEDGDSLYAGPGGDDGTYTKNHFYHIDILVQGDYDYTFNYSGQYISTAELNITKVWNDENNVMGLRPDSVDVQIYQNNTLYKTVTLTAAGNWTHTEQVPAYNDSGVEYTYSVKEVTPTYYESSVDMDYVNNASGNTATYTKGSNSIVFTFGSSAPAMKINGSSVNWSGNTATVNGGTWTFNSSTQTYTYTTTSKFEVTGLTSVYYTTESGSSSIPVSKYHTKWDSGHNSYEWFCGYDTNTYRRLSDLTKDSDITVSYYYKLTTVDEFGVSNVVTDSRTQVFTDPVNDNVCGEKSEESTKAGFDVLLSYSKVSNESSVVNEGDEYNATVTNTYVPDKVNVVAKKVWADDNPDDIASVAFHLKIDGAHSGVTKEANAQNDWTVTWENLPKYKYVNGSKVAINYVVEETPVDGYNVSYDRVETDDSITVTATNTRSLITTYVTVVKDWVDEGNAYGFRPNSIQVQLYQKEYDNSEAEWTAYGDPVELTASGRPWTYTWTELPLKDGEKTYVYYVDELNVPVNYEKEVELDEYLSDGSAASYKITNTFNNVTDVTVNKVWDDEDNKYNNRPSSITVKLFADGVAYTSATITPTDGNWSYTFEDVPKYKLVNGEAVEIVYTVTENAVPGYTTSVNGLTITNTLEYVEFSGTKTWVDNNNQDGLRPESIIVNLLANGTEIEEVIVRADANGKWTYAFTALPKYVDGEKVTYTVSEDEVEGYETSIDGYNITNTHEPETMKISVTKVWDDANNIDGLRPGSVTVNLLADGEKVKEAVITGTGNHWTYTFTDLPVYADGEKVVYTVQENAVEHYITTYSAGDNDNDGINDGEVTITNTHEHETVSLTVTKVWAADVHREDSVKIRLFGDNMDLYQYYNDNPTDGKNAEAYAVTLNEENSWTYTWTGLAKYHEGQLVDYSVWEEVVMQDGVPLYDVTYKVTSKTDNAVSIQVTNTYDPDHTEISVIKQWYDNDDQDGVRPEVIEVTLVRKAVEIGGTVTVAERQDPLNNGFTNFTLEDGKTTVYLGAVKNVMNDGVTNYQYGGADVEVDYSYWSYFWTELPYYRYDNGVDEDPTHYYVYAVVEAPVGNDYKSAISFNESTKQFTLVNTRDAETVDISGNKTWNDANNQDGIRPESITVNLLANGVEVRETTVSVDNNGEWKYSFTNLPKYAKGVEIVYTITEDAVEGYEAVVTDYDIQNTHIPETIDISGTKTWDDGENQDGLRPESITVKLLVNGEVLHSQSITEADGWQYTFEDLPKFSDGVEIEYKVQEDGVPDGYTAVVDGYNITNSYTPETTSVTIKKNWVDYGHVENRPDSITVYLYADNVKVREAVITADAAGEWTHTFSELPKYENGVEIEYRVKEAAVPAGYTVTVDGYEITNTLETAVVRVRKIWDDENNYDQLRPETITINLLADGVKVDSVELSTGSDTAHLFVNLPKFTKDGSLIVYTVEEEPVPGYDEPTSVTTGITTTITNKHTPETLSLTVLKEWNGTASVDKIRFQLVVDGTYERDEQGNFVYREITAENNWTLTLENLRKYDGHGDLIVYEVREERANEAFVLSHYFHDYSTHVIRLVNTATVDITVKKVWDDNNNADNNRTETVTFKLLANGEEVDSKTVGAADNWTAAFTKVNKYDAEGKLITYTIEEVKVDGYKSVVSKTVDGNNISYTVTNTLETVDISGTKTWEDADNQDGLRPESITVNLLADGTEIAEVIVKADANGKWSYAFTDLPKYVEGEKVTYTVSEDKVDGYETSIDGYNIINTLIPITVEIPVTKVWDDENNRDKARPESITVNLYAGEAEEPVASAEITAENDWKYIFTDLYKYDEDGNEIEYYVLEEEVEQYIGWIEGSQTEGFTITNYYETPVEIKVTKLWDDDNNRDGIRPESIIVYLLADGVKIGEIEITQEDNWTVIIDGLYKLNEDGEEIKYTISEKPVDGYAYQITGNGTSEVTITNKHEIETIDLDVVKKWVDNNDQADKRPDDITVQLYANGEKYGDAVKLDANGGWKYTFEDLPKYENGEEIKYSVKETSEKYYVTKYSSENGDLVITNTFVDIPLTGDTMNLIFWVMMVLGSGAVLGGIGVHSLRRRRS